jgi:pilus assembly protein CpaF
MFCMEEDIKERVNRYLINDTDFLKVKDGFSEDELRDFVQTAISDLCHEQKIEVTLEQRTLLIKGLVNAVMSMGPLRPLMEDDSITEIMINGPRQIYIQRGGKIYLTDVVFRDDRELSHTVQKILATSGSNKRVDESSPYVDFSLPDGSRVNVILPPCALNGPTMTIRKFKDDITTVDDILKLKTLNNEIATLLIAAMKAKFNIIFCGSTGSGKTTLLNCFSRYIPAEERIITIEDTPELNLPQDHVVNLGSKPPNIEGKGEITMADLFVNSLRMRPDRIIIGEIRGAEMLDLIQSISSGHSGSLAIVHAETPYDCFNRMVTMMLMTGLRLSTEEIQRQIARAMDIIVHVELFIDGTRRVTAVSDIEYNEETGLAELREVFQYKQTGMADDGMVIGDWVKTKTKPTFYSKFAKRMVKLPDGFFED